jgi:hypothetical protein
MIRTASIKIALHVLCVGIEVENDVEVEVRKEFMPF